MTDVKPGTHLVVRDEPINRENGFWAPHLGKAGTVVHVEADGLLDVILDDGVWAEGLKPERFSFADALTGRPPGRGWWSRFLCRSRNR